MRRQSQHQRQTRISSKRSRRKAPYVATIDQEYCCHGTITIPVEELDTYQHVPFGTPAWKNGTAAAYKSRPSTASSKTTAASKTAGAGQLGQAAHNFGLLALLIAHNLRQPNNFDNNENEPDNEQPPTPTSPRPSITPDIANGLKTRDPPP